MKSLLPLAFAATAVAVAGCSASVSFGDDPKVDSTELEELAATTLQEQVGSPIAPNIECGSGDIKLAVDKVIDCELSLDGDTAVYDVELTITSIDTDAETFHMDIAVADTPR